MDGISWDMYREKRTIKSNYLYFVCMALAIGQDSFRYRWGWLMNWKTIVIVIFLVMTGIPLPGEIWLNIAWLAFFFCMLTTVCCAWKWLVEKIHDDDDDDSMSV